MTWKIINENRSNSPPEYIKEIINDGVKYTTPKDIANTFNNYFISQAEKLSTASTQLTTDNKIDFSAQSMFLAPITPDDVNRIIKDLKNKNSVGYDDVSTKVVKYVSEIISHPLSYIINLSIESGTYPDKLKPTVIKPLFKKDDEKDIKNYRPIALIPVISKIFEKWIYRSIEAYLNKYNILVKEQKGFRKDHSINMAIYDFLNDIIPSMNERIPISAVYMDMTKAFDLVNHDILLSKLNAYGIRGNVLSLINSYLTNRTQHTEISRICKLNKTVIKYISKEQKIIYGVPQGSVLGPLLFLIYINDFPQNIPYPMTLFADDSTIIVKLDKSNNDSEAKITNALQQAVNWLEQNNLIINLKKTKIMNFRQRVANTQLNVSFNNENIEEVANTKFLGLTIDNQLNWKQHTSILIKKISKFAFALYKLKKVVSQAAAVTAYYGYVDSILRYGVMFWGNSCNRDMVFKSQKRCIRAITGIKITDSCKPYFISLKIMTLPCLYIFETAIFVKKNMHLFRKASEHRYKVIRPEYRHELCGRPSKTALMNKSILCMAPKIFNKLPNGIKDLNIVQFKNKLRHLLLEKCYYTIEEFLNDTF